MPATPSAGNSISSEPPPAATMRSTARRHPSRRSSPFTSSESPQSRCQPVPETLVNSIEEGLTADGPATLRNAQAVKSGDFESVWFIAADIQAAGIEGAGDIGVWAIGGTLESPGLTLAVDAVANESSDWPDDGETDFQLSIAYDGVSEAKECAE